METAFGFYSIHICHSSCSTAGLLKEIDVLPFCLLIGWELVPVSMVLLFFRGIPYDIVV
jgi:hypothetical protein